MPLSYTIILTVLVTGAMASDISRGRICNIWLLPAAVTGTISWLYTFITCIVSADAGVSVCRLCIRSLCVDSSDAGAFLTAVILTFIPYLCRGLGAGDVKLVAVSAIFMTPKQALMTIGSAYFLAGVLAALLLADRLLLEARKGQAHPAGGRSSAAWRKAWHTTIPFAIPYGIAVFLLAGGVLETFWQMI